MAGIYTGAVGARMRPVNFKSRRIKSPRHVVRPISGPLRGQQFTLSTSVHASLIFTLHGQSGSYINGTWSPL